MDKMLIFDWMNINEPLAHIEVDLRTKEVKAKDYDGLQPLQFFAKRPHTIPSIIQKFRSRCFEEGRPDKNEILESMGLTQYSPLDIVRVTHGHTNRDDLWVRFEGEEDLEYFRDINVLRPTLEERELYKIESESSKV